MAATGSGIAHTRALVTPAHRPHIANALLAPVNISCFARRLTRSTVQIQSGEQTVLPIAEVCPVAREKDSQLSWKKPALRLTAKGAALSSAILEDRAQ